MTNSPYISLDLIEGNYIDSNIEGVFVDYENGDFTITAEAMAKISAEISYFMPLSTENIGVTYEKGE